MKPMPSRSSTRRASWAAVLLLSALGSLACGGPDQRSTVELAGKPIDAWIALLESDDSKTRETAIDALGEAFFEEDDRAKFRDTIEPLRRCLAHAEADVRSSAALTLGIFKREALSATEDLCRRAIEDSESGVREQAIWALAEVAPPPRALVEAMFGSANLKPAPPDPDPARTNAASRAGLAAVEAGLADVAPEVRKRAVVAAGHWGRFGVALSPKLAPFLRDSDRNTQYVAVIACRYVGAPAVLVLDSLVEIVTHPPPRRPDPDVRPALRRAAASLLGDLGAEAREAAPALRRVRSDPELEGSVESALEKIESGGK